MYLLQYPLRAGDRSYDEHGAVQHVRAALSPFHSVGSAQLTCLIVLSDAAVLPPWKDAHLCCSLPLWARRHPRALSHKGCLSWPA